MVGNDRRAVHLKIGATDWGYRLVPAVRHSAHRTPPSLVPLTFDGRPGAPTQLRPGAFARARSAQESGKPRCSTASRVAAPEGFLAFAPGRPAAKENTHGLRRRPGLFTHRGLSGPGGAANLQLLAGGTPLLHLAPERSALPRAGAGQAGRSRAASPTSWPPGCPPPWPTPERAKQRRAAPVASLDKAWRGWQQLARASSHAHWQTEGYKEGRRSR